ITITASGQVCWDNTGNNQPCVGPRGTLNNGSVLPASTLNYRPWEFPSQEAGCGALIARIGNTVYSVGELRTISVTEPGTLKFMVNDRLGGMADITGNFHIVVR